MNHEMQSPAGFPIMSAAGTLDYLPAKEDRTPVKGQSSVLYYFSENRTPLSQMQQLSRISRLDPLSGAQLKTPGSTKSDRLTSHIYRSSGTPSSVRNGQRGGVYQNPFEAELVDVLHGPLYSPNVFKTSTPGQGSAVRFQWSIDDIAVLKPVDIEEPCFPDAWNLGGVNLEIEERAQKAIDKYFSSHVVMPSPWTDSAKKKPFILPATPGGGSFMDSPMVYSSKSTAQRNNFTPQKLSSIINDNCDHQLLKKEVASQTTVTLPKDFDLEALLRSHCVYQGPEKPSAPPVARLVSCQNDEDGTSQDALSNSSLRRKLFFHGDEGTPISPVRGSMNLCDSERSSSSDNQSPIRPLKAPLCSSGCEVLGSSGFADLSQIDQFSSSPIKVAHATPTYRRCSTAAVMMDSPTISPIRPVTRCAPTGTAAGWASESHQSPELRRPIPGQCSSSTSDAPGSDCTGKRRLILSTIDASFDMKIDDSINHLNQVRSSKIEVASMAIPSRANEISDSEEINDNAATSLRVRNATDAADEMTTSMLQDQIPCDLQSVAVQMVSSSDTGYHSNFLQVTGTASGNGCQSLQLDSVPPSMLAEEMSCDSSLLYAAVHSVDAVGQGKSCDCGRFSAVVSGKQDSGCERCSSEIGTFSSGTNLNTAVDKLQSLKYERCVDLFHEQPM